MSYTASSPATIADIHLAISHLHNARTYYAQEVVTCTELANDPALSATMREMLAASAEGWKQRSAEVSELIIRFNAAG